LLTENFVVAGAERNGAGATPSRTARIGDDVKWEAPGQVSRHAAPWAGTLRVLTRRRGSIYLLLGRNVLKDGKMLSQPTLGPPPAASPNAVEARNRKTGILERSFALLEAIAAAPAPPAVGDLIERLDLPRASVYRLVDWLLSEGLLAREPARKRLVIGNRLSELACDILRAAVATAPRRTLLEALARETGETCHIGTIDGNRIVYLDRVESAAWPLRLQLTVGSRVPLHATAIGKLFLALSPPRQRRALLAAVELVPLTPATITDRSRLEQELERVRAQGFAVDDQEFLAGAVAVAVPILNRRGEIRAGLALQAPEARMTAAAAKRHLPRLREAALQLARTFGAGAADLPEAPAPAMS
jgi:IclR family acetate operon transcriptional repressor